MATIERRVQELTRLAASAPVTDQAALAAVEAGLRRLTPEEWTRLEPINQLYHRYGDAATDMLTGDQWEYLYYLVRRFKAEAEEARPP